MYPPATPSAPKLPSRTQLGAAITVILASQYGIPVSSTMCITGASFELVHRDERIAADLSSRKAPPLESPCATATSRVQTGAFSAGSCSVGCLRSRLW